MRSEPSSWSGTILLNDAGWLGVNPGRAGLGFAFACTIESWMASALSRADNARRWRVHVRDNR
jgi:hypothetical protein